MFKILYLWITFYLYKSEGSEIFRRTNILFIIYDDLRPELSVYGRKHMETPSFDRLGNRSVIFDNAFCQVSVCNPSRDSMLTGLRPDTVGTYSFQWTYRPHMIFPSALQRSGYKTAGFGKFLHWETSEKDVWDVSNDLDWYIYQNNEWGIMNSSTTPDKVRHEKSFRDYMITSLAIEQLKIYARQPDYFFLALGMKLPHLCYHIPFKYYELYKNKTDLFKLSREERRFPSSTPMQSYRCCASSTFDYMNKEGAERHVRSIPIGEDANFVVPESMHNELMLGYCGGISYVDAQLGRVLDVIDELKLWNNLTVILTSDHGMHNGEKGLW